MVCTCIDRSSIQVQTGALVYVKTTNYFFLSFQKRHIIYCYFLFSAFFVFFPALGALALSSSLFSLAFSA